MNWSRTAMIFAHPAHEMLAIGLIQRYRPQILFLTRSDSGGDDGREELARAGLEQLGLSDCATFLSYSEVESYTWALAGDMRGYVSMRDQILDWLKAVRPTAVLGDAFELSNFHHDLGRLLVDAALREYEAETQSCPDNLELPLVCRTAPSFWELRFQEFPDGPSEVLELSAAELAAKKRLVQWLGQQRSEAAMAESLFPNLDREVYRRVPADRDYTQVPPGLQLHYDDWGRMQVEFGKHTQPILFAEHFLPIVRAVGLAPCERMQATS